MLKEISKTIQNGNNLVKITLDALGLNIHIINDGPEYSGHIIMYGKTYEDFLKAIKRYSGSMGRLRLTYQNLF